MDIKMLKQFCVAGEIMLKSVFKAVFGYDKIGENGQNRRNV